MDTFSGPKYLDSNGNGMTVLNTSNGNGREGGPLGPTSKDGSTIEHHIKDLHDTLHELIENGKRREEIWLHRRKNSVNLNHLPSLDPSSSSPPPTTLSSSPSNISTAPASGNSSGSQPSSGGISRTSSFKSISTLPASANSSAFSPTTAPTTPTNPLPSSSAFDSINSSSAFFPHSHSRNASGSSFGFGSVSTRSSTDHDGSPGHLQQHLYQQQPQQHPPPLHALPSTPASSSEQNLNALFSSSFWDANSSSPPTLPATSTLLATATSSTTIKTGAAHQSTSQGPTTAPPGPAPQLPEPIPMLNRSKSQSSTHSTSSVKKGLFGIQFRSGSSSNTSMVTLHNGDSSQGQQEPLPSTNNVKNGAPRMERRKSNSGILKRSGGSSTNSNNILVGNSSTSNQNDPKETPLMTSLSSLAEDSKSILQVPISLDLDLNLDPLDINDGILAELTTSIEAAEASPTPNATSTANSTVTTSASPAKQSPQTSSKRLSTRSSITITNSSTLQRGKDDTLTRMDKRSSFEREFLAGLDAAAAAQMVWGGAGGEDVMVIPPRKQSFSAGTPPISIVAAAAASATVSSGAVSAAQGVKSAQRSSGSSNGSASVPAATAAATTPAASPTGARSGSPPSTTASTSTPPPSIAQQHQQQTGTPPPSPRSNLTNAAGSSSPATSNKKPSNWSLKGILTNAQQQQQQNYPPLPSSEKSSPTFIPSPPTPSSAKQHAIRTKPSLSKVPQPVNQGVPMMAREQTYAGRKSLDSEYAPSGFQQQQWVPPAGRRSLDVDVSPRADFEYPAPPARKSMDADNESIRTPRLRTAASAASLASLYTPAPHGSHQPSFETLISVPNTTHALLEKLCTSTTQRATPNQTTTLKWRPRVLVLTPTGEARPPQLMIFRHPANPDDVALGRMDLSVGTKVMLGPTDRTTLIITESLMGTNAEAGSPSSPSTGFTKQQEWVMRAIPDARMLKTGDTTAAEEAAQAWVAKIREVIVEARKGARGEVLARVNNQKSDMGQGALRVNVGGAGMGGGAGGLDKNGTGNYLGLTFGSGWNGGVSPQQVGVSPQQPVTPSSTTPVMTNFPPVNSNVMHRSRSQDSLHSLHSLHPPPTQPLPSIPTNQGHAPMRRPSTSSTTSTNNNNRIRRSPSSNSVHALRTMPSAASLGAGITSGAKSVRSMKSQHSMAESLAQEREEKERLERERIEREMREEKGVQMAKSRSLSSAFKSFFLGSGEKKA
ncbi:hypothetical protein HDU97_000709 [Phlyctochytrium planicorne]|nr:hypothetical protein HDU97_000709 [Phlyctochytrium planicorne]